VSKPLTSAKGAMVVFDSAILPNWKDGKIRFNNVRLYRMPRSEHEIFERHAALLSAGQEIPADEVKTITDDDDDPLAGVELDEDEKNNEVLRNWMWYDLVIDRVEVTLSLIRWMDGKGLVQSADIQGVRGVVDRRHVRWDPDVPYDPVAARHQYTPGDFELEKLTVEDLLVTVYQPNGFRPYPVSIFQAQLDRFRKQW
jgi:distribution and morphology protein 31